VPQRARPTPSRRMCPSSARRSATECSSDSGDLAARTAGRVSDSWSTWLERRLIASSSVEASPSHPLNGHPVPRSSRTMPTNGMPTQSNSSVSTRRCAVDMPASPPALLTLRMSDRPSSLRVGGAGRPALVALRALGARRERAWEVLARVDPELAVDAAELITAAPIVAPELISARRASPRATRAQSTSGPRSTWRAATSNEPSKASNCSSESGFRDIEHLRSRVVPPIHLQTHPFHCAPRRAAPDECCDQRQRARKESELPARKRPAEHTPNRDHRRTHTRATTLRERTESAHSISDRFRLTRGLRARECTGDIGSVTGTDVARSLSTRLRSSTGARWSTPERRGRLSLWFALAVGQEFQAVRPELACWREVAVERLADLGVRLTHRGGSEPELGWGHLVRPSAFAAAGAG
jgi:hypothetical protein